MHYASCPRAKGHSCRRCEYGDAVKADVLVAVLALGGAGGVSYRWDRFQRTLDALGQFRIFPG